MCYFDEKRNQTLSNNVNNWIGLLSRLFLHESNADCQASTESGTRTLVRSCRILFPNGADSGNSDTRYFNLVLLQVQEGAMTVNGTLLFTERLDFGRFLSCTLRPVWGLPLRCHLLKDVSVFASTARIIASSTAKILLLCVSASIISHMICQTLPLVHFTNSHFSEWKYQFSLQPDLKNMLHVNSSQS